MNIPGFTAEASLDGPLNHYRFSEEYAGVANHQAVIPQRIKLTTVRCTCDTHTDICVCDNGRVLHQVLGNF
jgi:hypothetical protein